MTCPSCIKAQTDPDTPFQHAGCRGCGIRALAQSPLFHRASLSGRLNDPYLKSLAAVAGTDLVGGHAAVKAEKARLDSLRVLL